jgi:uncharacterized protein (TIGR03435 family)
MFRQMCRRRFRLRRLICLIPALAVGQNALRFEVASIRPNNSGTLLVHLQPSPGGRLLAENVPLKLLIETALGVKDYQVSGGPAWISSDRYDITAKAAGNPSGAQVVGPILESLLEDRFKLTFHRETRQVPTLVLTAARKSLKLTPAKEGACIHWSLTTPLPAPEPGQKPPLFCGFRGFGFEGTDQFLDMPGSTVAELAGALSHAVRQTVTDRTSLTGSFDIKLRWLRESVASSPDASVIGPSIYAALEEQLGLKLETLKGPVEFIVIDQVERPSAN